MQYNIPITHSWQYITSLLPPLDIFSFFLQTVNICNDIWNLNEMRSFDKVISSLWKSQSKIQMESDCEINLGINIHLCLW